uniref:Uncharacterized protein n=1 Tax=Ditylenchus dipsaci TaxID=166011 RepID=A0A915DXB4_9BILA
MCLLGALLPGIGCYICIAYTYLFQLDKVMNFTSTNCHDVKSTFPPVSYSIGVWRPQKYFWLIVLALHLPLDYFTECNTCILLCCLDNLFCVNMFFNSILYHHSGISELMSHDKLIFRVKCTIFVAGSCLAISTGISYFSYMIFCSGLDQTMPKTRDWKTQATCTTNEQLDGWKEENIHLYVHLKTEPGSNVMRIRKKSDLSVTYVQTIYEHGDHLPINDNGLKHTENSFFRFASLEDPDSEADQELQDMAWNSGGFTAALSLDDVQKMYEEHKDIPQSEDEPYCSGFGKQEVPVKDGDKEWQFYLIFTTKRLMKAAPLIHPSSRCYLQVKPCWIPSLVSASFS